MHRTNKLIQIFFAVGLITIGALYTLELLFLFLYKTTKNVNFSKKYIQDRLNESARAPKEETLNAGDNLPQWMSQEAVHPYLGYTYDPTKNPDANKWGFEGDDPIGVRTPNSIRVALFGGSVANHVYRYSREIIASTLKQNQLFRQKNIQIFNLSYPGYKQPQQLIALNLFLSLGAEFDVIVNLDGFNEVALNYDADLRDNIAPYYPWYWQYYSQKTLDTKSVLIAANIATQKARKHRLATLFSHSPLRQSIASLILWHYIDTIYERSLGEKNGQLKKSLNKLSTSYQTTGPALSVSDDTAFFSYASDVWYNSSQQMAKISKENNMLYIHLLQPNQYLKGSKKLSEEEMKTAYIEDSQDRFYKTAVTKGYPLLIKKSNDFISSQVHFINTTELYKELSQTIYVDTCCHVNQIGNDMLANTIAKGIIDYFPSE